MANRGKYKYDDLGSVFVRDAKLDSRFIGTCNHFVWVTSRLKNELDDLWRVKDNPDMHTNRYHQEKEISQNNKNLLDDCNRRRLNTYNKKITVDEINSIIQYYNSIGNNGRGVVPEHLYPRIQEVGYDGRISNKIFEDIINNYNGLNNWLNQVWGQSFNADGWCIKPCQVGCQTGCQVAAQLPSNEGQNWYPPNIGIRGYAHAYPGRYYSSEPATGDRNSDLWWSIVLVNCGKPWDEYNKKINKSGFIHLTKPINNGFNQIYAVTNNEIRSRVRAYNKERERYNRAQRASGRNPYGWLPYFSIELNTYVAPLNDYWLNSDHIDNNEMHGNGSHNYYNSLPKYAGNNRDGFVFVDYDTDWVVFGNSAGYENKTVDHYRYIKCKAKNVYEPIQYSYECSGCENR